MTCFRLHQITSFVLAIVVVLFGAPAITAAQNATSFRGDHQTFFRLLVPEPSALSFQYRYQPKNDSDGDEGSTDLNVFDLVGEVPLPLTDDLYLRIGGGYGARLYDFDTGDGSGRTVEDSNTYHKVFGRVGLGLFLTDSILLTAAAQPGVYSDFEGGISNDDFRLYGDSMLVFQFNPGAQVLFGVEASERFDDAPVFPFFGIRLLSEDGTLHLSATFPTELRVGYHFTAATEIYGGFWISGDEYQVTMGDEKNFRAHVQDNRLGIGGIFWLGDHLSLKLEGGLAAEGKLDLKVENPGQFEGGDLDSTGYLLAGAGINF